MQRGAVAERATNGPGGKGVRDSKDDGTGPVLAFNEREWLAFLDGARDGEFDLTELTASP